MWERSSKQEAHTRPCVGTERRQGPVCNMRGTLQGCWAGREPPATQSGFTLNVPHLDSTDPHVDSSRTVPCANASFPQRWGHMTNDLEAKVSHPLCGTPTRRSLDSGCNSEADRDCWLKSSERDGDVMRQGQRQPLSPASQHKGPSLWHSVPISTCVELHCFVKQA